MVKRIKIGDLVELPLSEGCSYGQITHRIPKKGYLIVIFKGRYYEKQSDFFTISQSEIMFKTIYFVQAALKAGLVEVVANVPIREDLRVMPTFKVCLPPELTGGKPVWRLWSPKDDYETGIKKLTKEENLYPPLQLISHDILVLLIEKNWTMDLDPDLLLSGQDSYDIIS